MSSNPARPASIVTCPCHRNCCDAALSLVSLAIAGSPSFLPLVRELCLKTGDSLEVREWPRLSQLSVSAASLDSYKVSDMR